MASCGETPGEMRGRHIVRLACASTSLQSNVVFNHLLCLFRFLPICHALSEASAKSRNMEATELYKARCFSLPKPRLHGLTVSSTSHLDEAISKGLEGQIRWSFSNANICCPGISAPPGNQRSEPRSAVCFMDIDALQISAARGT
jgi:hypothetical protein